MLLIPNAVNQTHLSTKYTKGHEKGLQQGGIKNKTDNT